MLDQSMNPNVMLFNKIVAKGFTSYISGANLTTDLKLIPPSSSSGKVFHD